MGGAPSFNYRGFYIFSEEIKILPLVTEVIVFVRVELRNFGSDVVVSRFHQIAIALII